MFDVALKTVRVCERADLISAEGKFNPGLPRKTISAASQYRYGPGCNGNGLLKRRVAYLCVSGYMQTGYCYDREPGGHMLLQFLSLN